MDFSAESLQGWFDLEGIADDGLGYSVNIIAAKGESHNRRYRLRRIIIDQIESASMDSSIKKVETVRGESQQSMIDDTKFPQNIMTRQSIEVRESFHEKTHPKDLNEKGFPQQNWSNEGIYGRSESANSGSPPYASTTQASPEIGTETVTSPAGFLKDTSRFSRVIRPSSRDSTRIGGPLRPLNSSQWWASQSR